MREEFTRLAEQPGRLRHITPQRDGPFGQAGQRVAAQVADGGGIGDLFNGARAVGIGHIAPIGIGRRCPHADVASDSRAGIHLHALHAHARHIGQVSAQRPRPGVDDIGLKIGNVAAVNIDVEHHPPIKQLRLQPDFIAAIGFGPDHNGGKRWLIGSVQRQPRCIQPARFRPARIANITKHGIGEVIGRIRPARQRTVLHRALIGLGPQDR